MVNGLEICNIFIKEGAECQVNVAATMRQKTINHFKELEEKVDMPVEGNEFQKIYDEVVLLVNTNSFPRFQKSEYWDHWVVKKSATEGSGAGGNSGTKEENEMIQEIRRQSMKTRRSRNLFHSQVANRHLRSLLRGDLGGPLAVLNEEEEDDDDDDDNEKDAGTKSVWFKVKQERKASYYINVRTLETTWKKPEVT